MEIAIYIAGTMFALLGLVSATLGALGHKGLCIWTGLGAFCFAGIAGACWLQNWEWKKDIGVQQPPLKHSVMRRPRFSERTDKILLLISSDRFVFLGMAGGRRVGVLGEVISARLVNNELVVDAKLSSLGAELKDNELINKPEGWDWQADENTFEIVDERKLPVFQLTYINSNTASFRGVFQGGSNCMVVSEGSITVVPATDLNLKAGGFMSKSIFKYPSTEHPKERR